MPIWIRPPLMLLGAISLLAGLAAGLERAAAGLLPAASGLVLAHGPLMVCGFLGTVIGLERAVALRRAWAFAGPLLTGVGGLVLVFGAGDFGAIALIAAGSAVVLAVATHSALRQRELFAAIMMLGAASWLVGNVLWLAGRPITQVVLFWIAFLVLTIGGERIELSRMMAPSRARLRTAPLPLALFGAALALGMADSAWAARTFGAGLVALTVWLLSFDIARRTVRTPGVTRFIGLSLLSGYAWLGLAGAMMAAVGLPEGGPAYDATLHAVFLGFVFAMIFGHAAVILPAILRVEVSFNPWFYAPLVLLHLSLAARLFGDFAQQSATLVWGAYGNAAAIILFLGTAAFAVLRGKRGSRSIHK